MALPADTNHILPAADVTRLGNEINATLSNLYGRCVGCIIRGADGDHTDGTCGHALASKEDENWRGWKHAAIRLPPGWCWFCSRPQMLKHSDGFHEWVEGGPANCVYPYHIRRALYVLFSSPDAAALLTRCPIVPPAFKSGPVDAQLFEWLTTDVENTGGYKLKNFLLVFHWVALELGLEQ